LKDVPRFDAVPQMPSIGWYYRSSDCRLHANRYAARQARTGPDRNWYCVGCLIVAPPTSLPASGDAPAAATQTVSQPTRRRRRRARPSLPLAPAFPRFVIAEPLRLAIINEDDSAVALTEPAPLNASGRAPAEPNIERSAAE
jgi:hypothetical protein